MTTIKDVAERAKVSRATVSRVLNNTGQVTDTTRERVTAAIRALNYSPSPLAQSLANNSSNTVGLMVSSFRGGFFGDLMAEVQEVVDSAGKLMIVTQGRHSAESERKAIEHLIKMRCDGLILHARYLSDEEIIAIAEKAPPLVLIDRNISKLANNCITFDHVRASEKAVEQLIGKGHRKIACMAGNLTKSKAYERFQGYINSLKRHQLSIDMNLVTEGTYERESGYRATLELLAKDSSFTAIYACSEEMAAGCIDAFRERNIRVPEDISLASYDSVDLCTFFTPHVTALHFPITDMARIAGCLLMHRIHPDRFDAPENTVFEGELRIRDSIKKLV